MVGNALDFARDCVWRQNEIDKSRANCAARHGIELCALFGLREGQTARRLDCTQTRGSVTAGPGKDDANPARSAVFSERFKKVVDRDVEFLRATDQCELAVLGDHTFVRRLHVNSVWLWRNCFCDLGHWHRCGFAEQIRKTAAVMGIEMLHDHKRHACPRRQMAQQFHRRFESAGRSADAHNRAAQLCLGWFRSRLRLG